MAANHALRQTFIFIDLIPMQQPEAYLSDIEEYIEEDGSLSEKTVEILQEFVDAFVKHIEKLA